MAANTISVAGRLVTRNTKIKAPDGHKVILVFGTMTVPVDASVGLNRMVNIDEKLNIDIDHSDAIPKKFHAWDAPDICEELFELESMREPAMFKIADQALKLISMGNAAGSPEAARLLPKIIKLRNALPEGDLSGSILESIIKVFEDKPKKVNTRSKRKTA